MDLAFKETDSEVERRRMSLELDAREQMAFSYLLF